MSSFSGIGSMGFDPVANWQMVPEGGWRPIELLDGTGLEVSVPPTSKALLSIEEPKGAFGFSRSFTVKGVTVGDATVVAGPQDPGPMGHSVPGGRATLHISILKKGIQRLKFYRVKDQAGHEAKRADATIEPMFRSAAQFSGSGRPT
jgi:hypothetical protein